MPETMELIILSSHSSYKGTNQKDALAFNNIISSPTFNSIKFARAAKKFLEIHNIQISLYVVGDPWESFWCAFFLRRIQKFFTPIQVQVHADIGDPRWKTLTMRNWVRYKFSRYAFKRAQSIRAVGKHQSINLIKDFQITNDLISVIPIPIKIDSSRKLLNKSRPHSLALVGRIDKDRGIWIFVELIKKLNLVDREFKVLIVGNGPKKNSLISNIEKIISANRFRYYNYLSEEELLNFWEQCGILVSCAPVESYGRVPREALFAGVPVWAVKSSGILDLMSQCDQDTVKILDLGSDPINLQKDFHELFKVTFTGNFNKKFEVFNDWCADQLVLSWLNTIRLFTP